MCNLFKIKHDGKSNELPCPMTLENFTLGQASPPDILKKFVESLQSDDGANHGQVTRATRRKAMSTASDDMYVVTNGRLKPSKHLCL